MVEHVEGVNPMRRRILREVGGLQRVLSAVAVTYMQRKPSCDNA
jgi:hypothetical protein